jgi:hypothetical protein
MPNLKLDLIQRFTEKKMLAELELVRLAQEPNMNYREKLELMEVELDELRVVNAKIDLVNAYFQEQQQQAAPAPAPQQEAAPAPAPAQPKGKVHQGQSHGE